MSQVDQYDGRGGSKRWLTWFNSMAVINKDRRNAGDASILAKKTFIPAIVWGVVFFAQSLYFGYMSIMQIS